jgi:hypothetical protein
MADKGLGHSPGFRKGERSPLSEPDTDSLAPQALENKAEPFLHQGMGALVLIHEIIKRRGNPSGHEPILTIQNYPSLPSLERKSGPKRIIYNLFLNKGSTEDKKTSSAEGTVQPAAAAAAIETA